MVHLYYTLVNISFVTMELITEILVQEEDYRDPETSDIHNALVSQETILS